MKSLAFIRIASLAIVVALKSFLPTITYQSLFFASLFAHYFLAHATTGPRLKTILNDRKGKWSFAGLIGLCGILWFFSYHRSDEAAMPLIVFIVGIHIVFSDVYSLEREYGSSKDLFAASLILNSVLYAMLLCKISPYNFLSRPDWLIVTGLAFVNYGRAWLLNPRQEGRWDSLIFQTAGLLVASDVTGRATYIDPIFYHVVFWLFYPHRPYVLGRKKFDWKLTGQLAALTGFFLLFTPMIGIPGLDLGVIGWTMANNLGSVPHFVFSLATSALNPSFLTAHFSAKRASISEPTARVSEKTSA